MDESILNNEINKEGDEFSVYSLYQNSNCREIKFKEFINLQILNHIIKNVEPKEWFSDETIVDDTAIQQQTTKLENYFKRQKRVKIDNFNYHNTNSYSEITYIQKSYKLKSETYNFGRYIGNGESLITISRKIRQSICNKFCFDLDIKNAQPTFLVWYSKRIGLNCDAIEYYIDNRDKCINDLVQTYDVSKERAKKDILAITNGGSRVDIVYSTYKAEIDWFKRYENQMKAIHNNISKMNPIMNSIAKKHKEKDYNIKGTTTNYILLSIENQVLMIIYDYIIEKYGNDSIGSLQYDGLLLSKEIFKSINYINDTLIPSLQNKISSIMDGLNVKLVVKPMDEGLQFDETELKDLPNVLKPNGGINYDDSGLNMNIISNITKSHIGISEILYDVWAKDNLKMINEKVGFYWNDNKKLWLEATYTHLENIAIDVLLPILEIFSNDLAIFYNQNNIIYRAIHKKGRPKKDDEETGIELNPEASLVWNSVHKTIKILEQRNISQSFKKLYTKVLCPEKLAEFDSIPNLLPIENVIDENGRSLINKVVDLKSGEILDLQKEHLFTKKIKIDYNPSIDISDADKFMTDISKEFKENAPKDRPLTQDEMDLKAYLIKFCGYCLTGYQNERKIYTGYGKGRNAKTLLFDEILKSLMGDFSTAIPDEVLFGKKSSSTSPELACLLGERFGINSETNENESFNSRNVKKLCGSDEIKGRRLFENNYFSLKNVAKIMIITNNYIEYNHKDQAMTDRMVQIPFKNVFENNPKFKNDLIETKLPQFLTLFIRGAKLWYEQGLGTCNALDIAKQDAINNIDPLQNFINSECQVPNGETDDKKYRYPRSSFYINYCDFLKERNLKNRYSKKDVFVYMEKEFGKPIKDSKGNMVFTGIRPLSEDDTDCIYEEPYRILDGDTANYLPEM